MELLRRRNTAAIALLLAALTAACVSATPLGRGIEFAHGQKIAVEAAAVEVIKLYARGVLPADYYAKAMRAYQDWSTAQTLLTESLAAYRAANTVPNELQVTAAISAVGAAAATFLKLAAERVNLRALPAPGG